MRVETKLVILAVVLLIAVCFCWLAVAQAAGAEHPAKPTVKPTVLNHQYLGWGSCRCSMCLGQHLRNYHGQKIGRLDAVGYRNWVRFHKTLHLSGVYKEPKPRSACAGGVCPPRRPALGRPILYRLFRRWRR